MGAVTGNPDIAAGAEHRFPDQMGWPGNHGAGPVPPWRARPHRLRHSPEGGGAVGWVHAGGLDGDYELAGLGSWVRGVLQL
jgi:hypothetical protein